jgi:hypothetical protein
MRHGAMVSTVANARLTAKTQRDVCAGMFGKIKEMAGSATLDKAIAGLEPIISEQLAKLQALGAEVIQDDPRYSKFVIEPAYLAVLSASNGMTKLIPEFKDRFARLMVNVRDELVVIEGNAVRVVEDFKAKLPQVLANSLKS